MSRLIEDIRLRTEIDLLLARKKISPNTMLMMKNLIDRQPSVDAVPVVRCKVCKRWGTKEVPGATDRVKLCEFGGYMVGENGYCVYGEKVE